MHYLSTSSAEGDWDTQTDPEFTEYLFIRGIENRIVLPDHDMIDADHPLYAQVATRPSSNTLQ